MRHFGDITKLKGDSLPIVDIVTGGSPCQDLSVAGKRAGLDGERSGLFMEQIRLIKEMRENDRRNKGADVDIRFLRPRFMVWENVPGAFSSNGGEDFRIVLEETAKVAERDACIPRLERGQKWAPSGCILGDGWSIAWRVHDAQFWGVPQRRKRIALVADFGGQTAPEILFECKSVSRNTEESGKPGKDAAADVRPGIEETSRAVSFQERAGRPGGGKGILIQNERTGALSTLNNQSVVYGICSDGSNSMKSNNPNSGIYEAQTTRTLDNNGGNPACNQGGMIVLENHPADSRVKISEDGIVQTLSSRMGTGGGNVPMVMETYQKTTGALMASGYDKLGTQEALNDMYVVQGQAWDGTQISPTLTANNAGGGQRMPDKGNFNAVIQCTSDGEIAGTLDASYYKGRGLRQGKERTIVAYGLDRASYNQGINAKYDFAVDEEKVGCQVAKGPGAVCCGIDTYNQTATGNVAKSITSGATDSDHLPCVANSYIVRRLTPMECERLQGYPDGWTDIGEWTDSKGKLHKDADSPRYKALGNSIALPFWQWMAERMVKILRNEGNDQPTMASLFDGIGGFPLVYSRCGCKPIWASEIEEFPMAVTKLRFRDEEEDE